MIEIAIATATTFVVAGCFLYWIGAMLDTDWLIEMGCLSAIAVLMLCLGMLTLSILLVLAIWSWALT